MGHYWYIFLGLWVCLSVAEAQDERYFRQLIAGELPQLLQDSPASRLPQFNVNGASYKVDLNGDGIEESIQTQKRDGVDWLQISNFSQRVIFEAKLLAMGSESQIYKLKLVHIKPEVKTLIVFLDEGFTRGRKFESTARIFLLTWEKNDLDKIRLTQGPHFFHEREGQREQYWRRDYMVNVVDIDGDGTREVAVQFNSINRIMRYIGNGEWERL
jgi:hypothetical protein